MKNQNGLEIASDLSQTMEVDDLIDAIENMRAEFDDPVLKIEERICGYNTYSALIIIERDVVNG